MAAETLPNIPIHILTEEETMTDITVEFLDGEGNTYDPEAIERPALCRRCARESEGDVFGSILCRLIWLDRMLTSDGGVFTCAEFTAREG
jgi:hypothetical protein